MSRIDEARHNADTAKADYLGKLRQVDSILRAEVSRDPETLAAALDVQASYSDGIPACDLAPNVQPASLADAAPDAEGVVARVVKKIKGGK